MRYVRKRQLRRDENGNVLGILPQALELRDGEAFLSVTWLEHFDPQYERGLTQAAEAIRRQLEVRGNDGFSTTAVGGFCDICERFKEKVRVLHEPVNPENTGHVAIRRFPRDNLDLLDLLASDAFVDTRVASHVVP
ncbi:MAG: hypothetical protein IID48_07870 [Proteobacteria bacterium]|nr:hypothetical protein [Pseudomonadota bacterium]